MNIDIKLEGIEEAIAMFDPKSVRRAASSAINKVADQAKTQASKAIREEYNIKAGELSKYLLITTRATSTTILAVITGKGRGLSLYSFAARQTNVQILGAGRGRNKVRILTRRNYGRATGAVTVQVKRTEGRKPVDTDPKAFIAQMKSGHIGVWKRIPGSQMPSVKHKREQIEQLFGPGVGHLFGSKKTVERLTAFINDKFPEIFQHELDYYSKK